MRDLEVLLSRVRDPDVREHFREAIDTYQVGAFRSTIINTWICVAFDLINKIRFLAIQGDGAAKSHVDRLDKAIRENKIMQLQDMERKLLDIAKELELISQREHLELERIYKDRHACAHPAFLDSSQVFSPSSELARVHLATAVDDALSLPPISGRKRIEELQYELDGDTWPIYGEKWSYIETQFLANVRSGIQRQILEFLLKMAIDPPDESEIRITPREMSKRAREAISIIGENRPQLIEEPLRSVLQKKVINSGCSDDLLLRMVPAIGHFPTTWEVLETPHVDRVNAVIQKAKVETLLDNDVFAGRGVINKAVRTSLDSRLLEIATTADGLESLLNSVTRERKKLVAPAMTCLSHSSSFRSAEHRLRFVTELADELCAEDISTIGAIISGNDQILFATFTESILIELYELVKESKSMVEAVSALQDTISKAAAENIDPAGGVSPHFEQLRRTIDLA